MSLLSWLSMNTSRTNLLAYSGVFNPWSILVLAAVVVTLGSHLILPFISITSRAKNSQLKLI